MRFLAVGALLALFCSVAQARNMPAADTTTHDQQFVTTSDGVKLEVLDYGGTGSPLIFLAGLGETAHDLDTVAARFTSMRHVYAITRRGFGASDKPNPETADYCADRLGDDVLEVIDKLRIEKPVIAGHSLAGEEMSSIGTRHPEKVTGLIYLDAGYAYALYVPGNTAPLGSNLIIAAKSLRAKLAEIKLTPGTNPDAANKLNDLQAALPSFEKDMAAARKALAEGDTIPALPDMPSSRIAAAIINGQEAYFGNRLPILAFYAIQTIPAKASPPAAADLQKQNAATLAQADAFAAANHNARVVRLNDAVHAIWTSNAEEVFREMTAFMNGLPVRNKSEVSAANVHQGTE
ncbi:MAG TPA: alpha/beta hydrolase [Rhizomicrobium sp.]|jgi:pimeloyl-ACP methyl ester carboxylesterase